MKQVNNLSPGGVTKKHSPDNTQLLASSMRSAWCSDTQNSEIVCAWYFNLQNV